MLNTTLLLPKKFRKSINKILSKHVTQSTIVVNYLQVADLQIGRVNI